MKILPLCARTTCELQKISVAGGVRKRQVGSGGAGERIHTSYMKKPV